MNRPIFLTLILSLLMTACGTTTLITPTEPTGTQTGQIPPDATAEQIAMLELVNKARQTSQTCGDTVLPASTPLNLNTTLSLTARKHSEDMKATSKMKHTTQAGAIHYTAGMGVHDRATQEGYNWSFIGENIAYGYSTEESVIRGWLESEGHCKNIMNAGFKELGVGRAGLYWTQVFAK